MTGVFALALAAGGSAYQATCLSSITGAARSALPRTASLSVHNIEASMTDFDGFAQRIVQAPVRR